LRALEQGTSVNALLRDFLEAYSGVRGEQKKAVKEYFGKTPLDFCNILK
jgi:hypothetical protein